MTTVSGNDDGTAGATDKRDIQAFWGALYDSLYDDIDSGLTHERLIEAIDALEDMFRLRQHMAVVEMPLKSLEGTRLLEVGCGAGAAPGGLAPHRDLPPRRFARRPHDQASVKGTGTTSTTAL